MECGHLDQDFAWFELVQPIATLFQAASPDLFRPTSVLRSCMDRTQRKQCDIWRSSSFWPLDDLDIENPPLLGTEVSWALRAPLLGTEVSWALRAQNPKRVRKESVGCPRSSGPLEPQRHEVRKESKTLGPCGAGGLGTSGAFRTVSGFRARRARETSVRRGKSIHQRCFLKTQVP